MNKCCCWCDNVHNMFRILVPPQKSLCDLCRTVNQCGLKHQNEEAQQVDLQGPD
uniref:Uncharacterized protein n=1 Tax=Anguilla anguilla TaxID=7936 RepID=A0A0E9T561_ANGAN